MEKQNPATMPAIQLPSDDELVDSSLRLLNPKQQRFVHLYLSGQHKLPDIATLLNMSYSGVRKWLMTPDIKRVIEEYQKDEDEIVKQGLKAVRLAALYKMKDLIDSPIDGIAYQAARDILDRTGYKAPSKQEVNVEIHTFEEQIKEAIKQSNTPEEFFDVEDYEVVDKKGNKD